VSAGLERERLSAPIFFVCSRLLDGQALGD